MKSFFILYIDFVVIRTRESFIFFLQEREAPGQTDLLFDCFGSGSEMHYLAGLLLCSELECGSVMAACT